MRESVYWPNLYKDIEMIVKCCAVCQESQAEHRQQPLLAHDVPSTSWTKVASDMFQIKGDNYLLDTDYHSKFYLVEKMHSTTSSTIANKSAQWFSMFGPPLEVVSDNGPQCVGQPYKDMCSKWMEHPTHYDIAKIYSIERSDRETSQDGKGVYPEMCEDRK